MNPWRIFLNLILLLSLSSWSFGASEYDVTMRSLLREMTDRDALAKMPEPHYVAKQTSSYDARSVGKDESGWFANNDGHGNKKHIRLEDGKNGEEWVLFESDMPGAITRIWMPNRTLNPYKNKRAENAIMRVYIDGADDPVIEGNVMDLMNGTLPFPYPFGHESLSSGVLFFPISYGGHCKITLSAAPFYYMFGYREYGEDVAVESFSMDRLSSLDRLMRKTGKQLANPTSRRAKRVVQWNGNLDARGEKGWNLPEGSNAIKELTVQLPVDSDLSVMRTTVLKIEFDGQETVWIPVGEFFGTGVGLNPFQGWYRTVKQDGEMSCRWTMPYRSAAKVSLENLADKPMDVSVSVKVGKWNWDDQSMHFHAQWRSEREIEQKPSHDWNFVTIEGEGVYVGDTLTVYNSAMGWWGEGDEKIWIDGEDFPSTFGTGSEDYYGYSWGGANTDFYEHPFHAQPRAYRFNQLHRKTVKDGRNIGYSTETRTRALDGITFRKSLQLDMEILGPGRGTVDYSVGMYWYGRGFNKSNRSPDVEGARLELNGAEYLDLENFPEIPEEEEK